MALEVKRRKFNEEDFFVPPSTLGEVAKAGWEEGFNDTFIMSRLRSNTIAEHNKQGPQLPAEQINKKYGINVSTPHTEMAAITIQTAQREKAERMRILNHAPDTFLSKAASLGGTLAGAMTDPVDFSIGAVLGWTSAGVAGALKATKVLKAVPSVAEIGYINAFKEHTKRVSTALLNRFAVDSNKKKMIADASHMSRRLNFGMAVIENGIASGITEMQAVRASEAEQIPYTAQQALTNVVAGSFLMTSALHGGSAALSKLFQAGPRYVEGTFNSFVSALEQGKNPIEATDVLMKEIDENFTITPAITEATLGVFGKKGQKYLDGSDNMGEVFERVRTDLEDFKLTKEDMIQYLDALEANGMKSKMIEHMESNPHANFAAETISEYKEKLIKEESNLGYSQKAKKLLNETSEKIEEKTFNDADIIDVPAREALFKARKEAGELDEISSKQIDEMDDFAVKETERIDALEAYAACRGIKF